MSGNNSFSEILALCLYNHMNTQIYCVEEMQDDFMLCRILGNVGSSGRIGHSSSQIEHSSSQIGHSSSQIGHSSSQIGHSSSQI
jgi:hypothetical protein